jgi:hypothetical protein
MAQHLLKKCQNSGQAAEAKNQQQKKDDSSKRQQKTAATASATISTNQADQKPQQKPKLDKQTADSVAECRSKRGEARAEKTAAAERASAHAGQRLVGERRQVGIFGVSMLKMQL